jgi:hypothetical protein
MTSRLVAMRAAAVAPVRSHTRLTSDQRAGFMTSQRGSDGRSLAPSLPVNSSGRSRPKFEAQTPRPGGAGSGTKQLRA